MKKKEKPLDAKQKTMIDSRKLQDIGITKEQLKEILDNKFKKYIAEDIAKLKTESKRFFHMGIIAGIMASIVANVVVTSMFRFVDRMTLDNLTLVLVGILAITYLTHLFLKEEKPIPKNNHVNH